MISQSKEIALFSQDICNARTQGTPKIFHISTVESFIKTALVMSLFTGRCLLSKGQLVFM